MADSKEDIVITGFSARFPEADSLVEFKEKLYAGADFVTDDETRWPRGHLGLPERMGKIRDLSLFDAEFFGVRPKQAHRMDPQMRILLETSYEAMVDAGYDPQTFRGRNVGVFIGCYNCESNEAFSADADKVDGYNEIGTSPAMFANRIAYCLDLHGPSLAINTACSSTMVALNHAVEFLRCGHCEAAIVGGAAICLKPTTALSLQRLGMLSPDGKCMSFDSRGNGYVRSETVGVFFLQRASEARRIYAKITHVKVYTDGYKSQGFTYPSSEAQEQLLRSVYAEAKVNPRDVGYIEAHGTGTPAGDSQEMCAISDVFCQPGRDKPLKVGAVKSNVGHGEAASGLSCIAKVILAMEGGTIAGNLHFKEANPNIPSLHDGSIEVVHKETPFPGGPVGINSFGMGGCNVHVILESIEGPHVNNIPRDKCNVPRLILAVGRSKEVLVRTLDRLEEEGPYPDSAYALLNMVGQPCVKQFPYRGFAVIPVDDPSKEAVKFVEQAPCQKRPVWFVFTGMGCHWRGMAQQMMQFDVFSRSIRQSHEFLSPFGVDLIDVVTNEKVEGHSMASVQASIAAVQVALVDTLNCVGIQPDGMVGHSVGEIGCAYADSCLTAEQAVVCAYWRGHCIGMGNLPKGAMAAVGLTWEEAAQYCRDGVVRACHNAEDSVTMSGPARAVSNLVAKLKAADVFAREVDTMGVAFHSQDMQNIAPMFQKALRKVVPEAKPRSKRWISSSVPKDRWQSPVAQNCSVEYLVNNLVDPVLFNEALSNVPQDAILVEVGPHCLLQPILRRALGPDASCLGLMKRNEENLTFFLKSLGKLHTLGVQLDLSSLYPPVPFPVPRGTPSIGHLVSWDHSQRWTVTKWNDFSGSGRVQVMPASGHFEVSEGGSVVASGRVRMAEEGETVLDRAPPGPPTQTAAYELNSEDVYKELALRGYEHHGVFRSILSVHLHGPHGKLKWTDNWTAFIDGMFKFCVFLDPLRTLKVPTRVHSCCIDTALHAQLLQEVGEGGIHIAYDSCLNTCRAGGVVIRGIETSIVPVLSACQTPRLEEYRFVPYVDDEATILKREASLREYVDVCNTIVRHILGASGEQMSEVFELLKNSREVPLKGLEQYLRSSAENNGLVRILTGIRTTLNGDGSSLPLVSGEQWALTTHKNDLVKDIVYTALLEEDPLRHLLDVAVENTRARKIRILELASEGSDFLLTPSVSKMISLSDILLKIEYAIGHQRPEDIMSQQLPESTVKFSWDPTSTSGNKLPQADLVIASVLPSISYCLETLADQLSAHCEGNGFALLFLRTALTPAEVFLAKVTKVASTVYPKDVVISVFANRGFRLVALKSNKWCTLLLLRKIGARPEVSEQETVVIDNTTFGWVEALKAKVIECGKKSVGHNLWLLAKDSGVSGVVGLMNCLRRETGASRIRCLFDASLQEPGKVTNFTLSDMAHNDMMELDLVMNVQRDGRWGSFRHLTMLSDDAAKKATGCAFLNVQSRGDLFSLKWFESPLLYMNPSSAAGQLLCDVYYAPLNFRDVSLATGKLPPDAGLDDMATSEFQLGLEFSGRDRHGRRVMGLVPGGGLSTTVAVDPDWLWEAPEAWSLQEASTVPVAYSTAYYALFVRGNMRPGESLLVHYDNGGVGEAAISIALSMGCTVFITVGCEESSNFLKLRFPQLGDRNIASSTDQSFERHVLLETNGRGVNLVLGSQYGQGSKSSVRCLAKHGRFLEIGTFDLAKDNPLRVSAFNRSILYHDIRLEELHGNNPFTAQDRRRVRELVRKGIASGEVRPLATKRYGWDQAEEAFRHMASGKNTGKAVIEVRPEENPRKTLPASPVTVETFPRTYFYEHKSYIIVGGLGGVGMELADWMLGRGCRKLLVLSDGLLENQSAESFELACKPKVDGTLHLDKLSRMLCPDLDHFVVFSSVVSGRGHTGLTNYGYANSVMERICERRAADGLPGLAIQWGPIGDVGVLDKKKSGSVDFAGCAPQKISSCMTALDQFLGQRHPVVSSIVKADSSSKCQEQKTRRDLVETIAQIFGLREPSTLNPCMSIGELGMDSLTAIEVKHTLEQGYDITLSVAEIRLLTFNRLREMGGGGGEYGAPTVVKGA